MSTNRTPAQLGTDKVVWKLDRLYSGAEDPAIAKDVAEIVAWAQAFKRDYKGQLGSKLGAALAAYGEMGKKSAKVWMYFSLSMTQDTTDSVMRREQSKMTEKLSQTQAKYLTFFELEIGRLSDAEVAAQTGDAVVAHHLPYIGQLRALAKYNLDEKVEQALALQAPYGSGEWSDMLGELDSQLRFTMDGKVLNLTEILNVVTEDRDPAKRAQALKIANEGLEVQRQTYLYARGLNVLVGSYLASDDMRGLTHPMQGVNLGNMVDDATVDALHDVVATKGVELGKRYYKLKARMLGLDKLAWSDRNAPPPFAPEAVYTWDEARTIVKQAYRRFSPTLGDLVDTVLDPEHGWVDAATSPTKTSGAFNETVMLPDAVPSYVMINYMGSTTDMMTLAHELGHAVHGLLATEAQGAMMWHAPMPYAETASIFGEMLTFESMLAGMTDKKEKLALYANKMDEFCNSVIRQINFSEFVKGLHARRRDGKLSSAELDSIWVDLTKRFYGVDGEVFTYENIEHLWSYVGHFHAYRFYVYSYSFGELFTQSLMATRDGLGERFEPLYLELLRAGGTKDAVALMAPFGLNPNSSDFWEKGLEASMGKWIVEAEKLAAELGL